MCSRYGISERVEQYILSYGWNRQLIAGDVRPQDMAPVLARQGNMVAALPMAWGMHNPKTGQLIINAREESAAGKAMFSRSLRTQRCILPAEKFYEWDAAGHKVTFQREDDSLLHLCGIYRYEGAVPCFVILTKAADSIMRPIHDRMPVMINAKDVNAWLFDDQYTQELMQSDVRLVCSQPVEEISLF